MVVEPRTLTRLAAEMAEAEPDAAGPRRRCIVTRALAEKNAMIRFVLDPSGVVTPDLKARLPGRGLWVMADREVLQKAVERNAFAKAAKTMAMVPADLGDRVRDLAEREVIELIGLAKRAGQLVAGFEKVRAVLRRGKVRLLLAASDAAEDGRGKLARLAEPGVDIRAPLNAAALASALGREHAVHVAVTASGLAERLAVAIARLEGLAARERQRITH